MATYRGQAEKWIYPKIGAKKLADFKATNADRFFRDAAKVLGKSSLMKMKSTLRSVRDFARKEWPLRGSPADV